MVMQETTTMLPARIICKGARTQKGVCTEAFGHCATSTGQKFEPKPQLRNLPLIIFVRTQTFLLRSMQAVQRLSATVPPQLGKSSNQSHSFGIWLL